MDAHGRIVPHANGASHHEAMGANGRLRAAGRLACHMTDACRPPPAHRPYRTHRLSAPQPAGSSPPPTRSSPVCWRQHIPIPPCVLRTTCFAASGSPPPRFQRTVPAAAYFTTLRDRPRPPAARSSRVAEQFSGAAPERGPRRSWPPTGRVGTLYEAFMDEAHLEELGAEPLAELAPVLGASSGRWGEIADRLRAW